MAKITAQEFLTDPKHGESKSMMKEILVGLATEMKNEHENDPKNKNKNKESESFWDMFFGG